MDLFKRPLSFEWDRGNQEKNWVKHRVSREECEEIFFDAHKRLLPSPNKGDLAEARHLIVGRTRAGRILFIVFTMREDNIRVISARDLNKKERGLT